MSTHFWQVHAGARQVQRRTVQDEGLWPTLKVQIATSPWGRKSSRFRYCRTLSGSRQPRRRSQTHLKNNVAYIWRAYEVQVAWSIGLCKLTTNVAFVLAMFSTVVPTCQARCHPVIRWLFESRIGVFILSGKSLFSIRPRIRTIPSQSKNGVNCDSELVFVTSLCCFRCE